MSDELVASGLFDAASAAAFRREGHFCYESGWHGDTRLALELLFADPRRLRSGCARLAARLQRHDPEVICGALVGGALIGQWVAYELGLPFVFAGPQSRADPGNGRDGVPPALRSLLQNRRVAIVDDAINAGAATLDCAREVAAWGGRAVAAGSLVARVPGAPALLAAQGIPLEYLVGLHWRAWTAADCPLCRSGVPLEPAI